MTTESKKALEEVIRQKRLELRNVRLGIALKTDKRSHLIKQLRHEIAQLLTKFKQL